MTRSASRPVQEAAFCPRGRYDQFVAMQAALRKAGKEPETLVVDGEGHGFYKPENKARLFQTLAAFLDKHIGAGAR